MKVKTLITLYSKGEFTKPGTVIEMPENEALVMIGRKFVEAVMDEIPAASESETDEATRQIGQVVEPETLVGETIVIPEHGSVIVTEALEDGTLVAESLEAPVEAPVEDPVEAPVEDPVEAPVEAPVVVEKKGKKKGK